MWFTLCAAAFTGQKFVFVACWCIVCPMWPFFWFVIFNVHESAVSSVLRLLFLGSMLLSLKNPILFTVNWTVLVALFVSPFFLQYFGFVYSPTLRRKKNAIVESAPNACSLESLVLKPEFWHSSATSTGIAICGVDGGSSLL